MSDYDDIMARHAKAIERINAEHRAKMAILNASFHKQMTWWAIGSTLWLGVWWLVFFRSSP